MPWSAPTNRLARASARLRESGAALCDLTTSNPTIAGFDYPLRDLERAFGAAATAPYAPHPRGLLAARTALAETLSSSGDVVDPDDLFLTASTSEAYSYLFKLLADAGDEVVTARPAYPLLEHIAALESLSLRHYSLMLHSGSAAEKRQARWSFELSEAAAALTDRARAVVVVHPNNPTGNFLSTSEAHGLIDLCSERQIALISDEVFFDYAVAPRFDRAPSLARFGKGLIFSLGGLSKSVGLPHFKLGWIRVGGERALAAEAKSRLELVADSFLSVATPVQIALPSILAALPDMQSQIGSRLSRNLETLRGALAPLRSLQLLEPEGGWSAVIRVPRLQNDEELALELLEKQHVVVQPGYFYDFESDGFIVVSLLCREDVFTDGVDRLVNYFSDPSFS